MLLPQRQRKRRLERKTRFGQRTNFTKNMIFLRIMRFLIRILTFSQTFSYIFEKSVMCENTVIHDDFLVKKIQKISLR